MYIKCEIHILPPPPPFLIDIFSPNEISYNEVMRAAGEKIAAFFWAILYILSQLGEKYAFSQGL